MDICCLLPQSLLAIIPLIGGVTDFVVTRTWTEYWVGLLFCSVVVTAPLPCQGWGLFCHCCRAPHPRLVSYLCFWYVVWGMWDWSAPSGREVTGREATEYSSSGAVYLWVCSAVSSFSHSASSQIILIFTALSPTITMGMLVIGSGILQALFLPGNQCRSTESQVPGLQPSCIWACCGYYRGSSDSGL